MYYSSTEYDIHTSNVPGDSVLIVLRVVQTRVDDYLYRKYRNCTSTCTSRLLYELTMSTSTGLEYGVRPLLSPIQVKLQKYSVSTSSLCRVYRVILSTE